MANSQYQSPVVVRQDDGRALVFYIEIYLDS